ncbi:MAG: DUF1893 domain-containing protein [Oscillospiraceae bacterium]|nr:DUF1893 domain-containing protein [Oscillospiraceae bacterium]
MDNILRSLLLTAQEVLLQGEHSCVVCDAGGMWRTSKEPGIRPVLRWLREDSQSLKEAVAADKVVGRAAAMLFAHGGAKALWAELISDAALDFLAGTDIVYAYGARVPAILNREGTSTCPMEERALRCETAAEAFEMFDKMIEK